MYYIGVRLEIKLKVLVGDLDYSPDHVRPYAWKDVLLANERIVAAQTTAEHVVGFNLIDPDPIDLSDGVSLVTEHALPRVAMADAVVNAVDEQVFKEAFKGVSNVSVFKLEIDQRFLNERNQCLGVEVMSGLPMYVTPEHSAHMLCRHARDLVVFHPDGSIAVFETGGAYSGEINTLSNPVISVTGLREAEQLHRDPELWKLAVDISLSPAQYTDDEGMRYRQLSNQLSLHGIPRILREALASRTGKLISLIQVDHELDEALTYCLTLYTQLPVNNQAAHLKWFAKKLDGWLAAVS